LEPILRLLSNESIAAAKWELMVDEWWNEAQFHALPFKNLMLSAFPEKLRSSINE
jgi:hypothetical protein